MLILLITGRHAFIVSLGQLWEYDLDRHIDRAGDSFGNGPGRGSAFNYKCYGLPADSQVSCYFGHS
jgi:hypothetical protein